VQCIVITLSVCLCVFVVCLFVGPPYYSQHAVFASPLSTFFIYCSFTAVAAYDSQYQHTGVVRELINLTVVLTEGIQLCTADDQKIAISLQTF